MMAFVYSVIHPELGTQPTDGLSRQCLHPDVGSRIAVYSFGCINDQFVLSQLDQISELDPISLFNFFSFKGKRKATPTIFLVFFFLIMSTYSTEDTIDYGLFNFMKVGHRIQGDPSDKRHKRHHLKGRTQKDEKRVYTDTE